MNSHRHLWLLTFILIFAAATRFYHIQNQSIWFDEGWSAYAANQPTLRAAFESDTTNPPLYYVLLNINVHFVGDSEFSLRLFSTMFDLLAIALIFQLTWRLVNIKAGIYTALLATCLPLTRWAAQEARMYSLMLVLILIMTLAWFELLKQPKRWAWLALWASEAALLYSHNTGLIAALWINSVMLLSWLLSRKSRRSSVIIWFAGQIGVVALWSPWIIRYMELAGANNAIISRPELSPELLGQIWQAFWAGPWEVVLHNEPTVIILAAVAFAIFIVLFPWRSQNMRWLFVHGAILTAGLVLALIILQNPLHGRYLVIVAPFLIIPLGTGISQLSLAPLKYGVCIFFVGLLFYSIQLTDKAEFQHDDTRGIVGYYAAELTGEDSVLAWSYAQPFHLQYYWEQMDVQAKLITLPEGAGLDKVMPLVPQSGRIAHHIWYGQRADYSGMLDCALSQGITNPPENFTVAGMTSLLYQNPSRQIPPTHQVAATTFEIAKLISAPEFISSQAERAQCLPVEIELTQSVASDLKALIMVRNRLGWTIATADALFSKPDYRLSSRLSAGDTLTAYPLIWLPYGAPAGDYEVYLRIYDEQSNAAGYDLLSPSGAPFGKDLHLGTWTVAAGDWSQVERHSDLPTVVELPVSDNLILIAHNGSLNVEETVHNGSRIPLAFLWRGTAPLPEMTLVAEDNAWVVTIPAAEGDEHNLITLDWREARIPPDAESGAAELRLLDNTIIARYEVKKLDAQFIAPDYESAVNAEIPGIGQLVGYTLSQDILDLRRPVELTLVWRAAGDITSDYTVFAQLLNAEGKLIAQSDSAPAAGQRPTSGWREGEYIVDTHQLNFNQDAAPGKATLIVGMYDAKSGQRIVLQSGEDFVMLATDIPIS